ncbi:MULTISPECIES: ROK family transcriptional regulator [Protofrankia]|uniref:ROK family protein n=1 Tax=Candidatus Protofrankia datiscae TaxID=2716812 RepID=F8AXU6_9ACTN|nr:MULTISPECIES: ROK family transcriptional regulator [Protofrankia]AEH11514.1 ROK family protein [Candidatus Protofrankia datiscae]
MPALNHPLASSVTAGRSDPTGTAAAVLRAVLDHGPVARTLIGRATGLSPAVVSRQTADLISLGLLRELPALSSPPRAGRPFVPLDIDTQRHLACGVHIAVPNITFGLVDLRGQVVAQESVPHQGDAREVLRQISQYLPGFVARHARGSRLLGLGVVTGGWVDPQRGVIVEHGLLGWSDVPVRQVLAETTGLPVHVDGHARALAQAEIMFGDPRARRSLVHLFVGNVVDAAIATGGEVHWGPHAGAGDVAHLPLADSSVRCPCGRSGCVQAAISERVLAERAFREGRIEKPDLWLLLDAARCGDQRVLALFRDRLRVIGRVVALLLDVIDPEVLVLTEAAAIFLPDLLPDLYEQIAAHSRVCDSPERIVLPTRFGAHSLAVAASATVLDAVHRSPRSLRPAPAPASARARTRARAGAGRLSD